MSTSVWPPQCMINDELNSMSLANTSISSPFHMEDVELLGSNITTSDLVNASNSTGEPVSYYSNYFWLKIFLLFFDLLGLLVNGLGIDMLWHGVEINHAVYFVILQDVCLAFGSAILTQLCHWFFWMDDLAWFQFHCFLGFLPLAFHNWAWASVAHLR